jgi:hypothetical protein
MTLYALHCYGVADKYNALKTRHLRVEDFATVMEQRRISYMQAPSAIYTETDGYKFKTDKLESGRLIIITPIKYKWN